MLDKLEGLWIPKEMLLNHELSLQEKVLLSSIKHLSGNAECYASNHYFAELLGLSKKRVEGVLKRLDSAGYISRRVTYKEGSKQVEARFIKLTPPPLKYEGTTPLKSGDTSPQKRGSNSKADNKENNSKVVIDNCSRTIGDISQDLESDCFDDIEQYNNQANQQQKPERDSKSKSGLIEKERKCFVSELDSRSFVQCHEAMKVLEAYKSEGNNIYTGHMALKDWVDCEEQMAMVDFDANDYFKAFDEDNRFAAFKKKSGGSLKDFLLIGSQHDFEQAYEHIIS